MQQEAFTTKERIFLQLFNQTLASLFFIPILNTILMRTKGGKTLGTKSISSKAKFLLLADFISNLLSVDNKIQK